MLHHISIGVSDLNASIAFYDAVLEPLGYMRLWCADDAAGYGLPGQKDEQFAIKREPAGRVGHGPRSHVAFASPTRRAVADFHATALAHGAIDDGAPELHADYGADYFAAFVIDRDGYRLEAVCLHVVAG